MGIPEERRKREKRTFKEIITENFPNLGKEMDVYIHETGTTSNYISAEGPFPRHIKTIKSQWQRKNLKDIKGKKSDLQRYLDRLAAYFSVKPLQAGR